MKDKRSEFGSVLGTYQGFTIRQNPQGKSGVSILVGKKLFAGPYKSKELAIADIVDKFTRRYSPESNPDLIVKIESYKNGILNYGVFYKGKLVSTTENQSFPKCVNIADGIAEQKHFYRNFWTKL